jgi:hypothetical protein
MMTTWRSNSRTAEKSAPPQPASHQESGNDQEPAEPAASPGCPSLPERILVALIPRVVQDLQRLQDQTSLSMTDIVNRAITLYEFIEAQRSAGHALLIRDTSTGETQAILMG